MRSAEKSLLMTTPHPGLVPYWNFDSRWRKRLEHLIEFLVFLSLLVPSYVLSFFASGVESGSFTLGATANILRDLSLVALVGFFLWRNGEAIDRIGWTRAHALREVALGLILFIPVTATLGALAAGLQGLGLSLPKHTLEALTPGRGPQTVLAVVLVLVVAIAEETIFRGYVLYRLREASGSTVLAVLLSTILFALGHGYEGAAGMILAGWLGLVFALVYLWRKNLAAPVAMHFCQDLVAIALAPYLVHGR